MRRLLAAVLIIGFALPASAAADQGDGVCLQEDGQAGLWDGSTTTDDGCTTPAEYEVMFSPTGLLDSGVVVGYESNEDGTATLDFGPVKNMVKSNPLERTVAANRDEVGPTVREWFGQLLVRFGVS